MQFMYNNAIFGQTQNKITFSKFTFRSAVESGELQVLNPNHSSFT